MIRTPGQTYSPVRSVLAVAVILGSIASPSLGQEPPDIDALLDAARTSVVDGRTYFIDFPQSRTRRQVREQYLGVDGAGQPSSPPKHDVLRDGMMQALAIRSDTHTRMAALPSQIEAAQALGWEALEALLQGQLIAGNANLLKGLRVAFPGEGGGEKPGGETDLPFGSPGTADGKEYYGANILDLSYGRLHFFRGILAAIDFMNADWDGEVRAIDRIHTPAFAQYTAFEDPNFGEDLVDIQTAGYLLGNILDRYGKSVVAIADRLWRAAYFDRARAPGGSRAHERQAMLDAAVRELQSGMHSQFMAVLPLAATLDDGSTGEDAYQLCGLDQARASAATARAFIDRIQRGEVPKLTDMRLHASTSNINNLLSQLSSLKERTEAAYAEAADAIWQVKSSEDEMINDAQELRSTYGDELFLMTSIRVGNEDQAPYFGLATQAGRNQYRADVIGVWERALDSPVTHPFLTQSGQIGAAVLNFRRAEVDLRAAKQRIDDVPQQILIEQERVNQVINVRTRDLDTIRAHNLSADLADSFSVSAEVSIQKTFGLPPSLALGFALGVSFNPLSGYASSLRSDIDHLRAMQEVDIDVAESEATVKNLLIQQAQYRIEAQGALIQLQLAAADMNALIGRIEQFIDSHTYFQDTNRQKWYYDPALIFEQEQAEIEYETHLTEYRRELYRLSQLLASRWSEPYENPYLQASGVAVTLGGGLYDDFTQPESVFNIYRVQSANAYYLALKAWDGALRSERYGGQADIVNTLSLRQDILGLSDYVWDENARAFVFDADLRAANIRRFKAFMIGAETPNNPDYWMRIEFPLVYNQASLSVSGASRTPVIRSARTDWNIRVTELSAQLLGQNVAPGATDDTYRIDLYQYGKIEIPRYHPRQTNVPPNFLTFNLPLYYPDPMEESISPFQYTLQAGLNNTMGTAHSVTDREPTPFCTRYVLLAFRSAGPLNVHNIEDIRIRMKWRSGLPPTFTWAW